MNDKLSKWKLAKHKEQAMGSQAIHLAAATNKATITESNSHLLGLLITNNPEGELRRPPQSVLEQLGQANQHYKIGHLLCRSRNPDFLLDILQRQVKSKVNILLAKLIIFCFFFRVLTRRCHG